MGILLAVLLLPISIWAIRNYSVFGEPVFTTTGGGYVLYESHNPLTTSENGGYDPDDHHPRAPAGSDELARDESFKEKAIEFVKNNPEREMRLTLNSFWNVWRPALAVPSNRNWLVSYSSYLQLILLAMFGIIRFGLADEKFLFLSAFLMYFFLFHLFIAGEMRFRYPLLPALSIFAVAGLGTFFRGMNDQDDSQKSKKARKRIN